jgi:type I restriction enzyme M protein
MKTKPTIATTPAARLSSVIKSSRDIMRKDAGLNGDLDRIPEFSWILFLKCFDDLEQRREITDKNYKPAIRKPFRWRDWAANPDKGMTGDELLKFVNDELFPHLRSLVGTNGERDQRAVIAEVFRETFTRFRSGYLVRDVVNLVNSINFNTADDIHTMAHLYESMLKEMRDSAGDSGEFYTPRPVIRFIVQMVQPKLGDTIFDPACGTGGFLVEAYELLKKQVKTKQDRDKLQYHTLRGVEKKPMPYLLGMMNLLLHEIDRPNLSRSNALIRPLNEIGDKDRVNIIVTNPPFGGEEEKGIQLNFPEATRCSETALLFLQLIMRSLKKGGRCGMVVPNGTLFGDGVCARLKEQLLKDFNLHTIVRLPNGVFAPYTSIPTNLLFFDRTEPAKEIWYYEQPLPEGRKTYTKTQPLRFEEFADCIAWWGSATRSGRKENDRAWRVPAERIIENGFNLDIKNPSAKDDFEHLPPEQLAADILKKEQHIAEIMAEIQKTLAEKP